MPNWKSIVHSSHAKVYVLPDGWDSKAKVADDLGCSEDQAARIMAPLVKSGAAQSDVFPVFDKLTERIVRVTAYRKPEAKASAKK